MTQAAVKPISALLVDPALFTGPYDAALTYGLEQAEVEVRWASRPLRDGEEDDLDRNLVDPLYYRGVQDGAKGRGAVLKLRKAASHLLGGLRLLRLIRRRRFDIVHFQWAVLPIYDGWIMRQARRWAPVVLTVHDTTPFNGDPTSRLQTLGFDRALRSAARIIVHTASARETLVARGCDPDRIRIIAHGLLRLRAATGAPPARPDTVGERWTVVLFGKLQPYKGADVLIEALGALTPDQSARLRVIIAGEPMMPVDALQARIIALGLGDRVELRLHRHSEAEMAALFADADAFVFPYRQIEASGVLFLVLPFGKWIVASDLGAFRDAVIDGRTGERTPPGDAGALGRALVSSIGRLPETVAADPDLDWRTIGRRTRAVYQEVLDAAPRQGAPRG